MESILVWKSHKYDLCSFSFVPRRPYQKFPFRIFRMSPHFLSRIFRAPLVCAKLQRFRRG